MANITGYARRIGYAGDRRVPYARAGWEDARNGRVFDYNLVDRAPSPAVGAAYETARLRVMALIEAGSRVPAWRADIVPPAVHGAITKANIINKAARDCGTPYWR